MCKRYQSLFFLIFAQFAFAQNIGDFISVEPLGQNTDFVMPSTHVFQKIIETGDPLTQGGFLPGSSDFTGYVPISGSSENGYLSINSERNIGAVSILDINFNTISKLWETTYSQAVDFTSVAGTTKNCSGAVTPWNTIISCEEEFNTIDSNSDNYDDFGWCVEIDPQTKMVIDKRWALGKFAHENITIHANNRTVYQRVDDDTGYLYKFVADVAEDLSSGDLYVYSGSKNGPGNWVQINNTTPMERNTTLDQSAAAGGTIFEAIEDVEIGPDGMVYFAVKNEHRVYRFQDSDPLVGTTVLLMETFVGDQTYDITHTNGTTAVDWGTGNDNLAFDGQGNLWVLQDGGNDYIWVVGDDHTQAVPKVRIFGRSPIGSEPTGITFSPDFRFLFMAIQHPDTANNATFQTDAAGNQIGFEKDIALEADLGSILSNNSDTAIKIAKLFPNPIKDKLNISFGEKVVSAEMDITNVLGQSIYSKTYSNVEDLSLSFTNKSNGIYYISIRYADNRIERFKFIKGE